MNHQLQQDKMGKYKTSNSTKMVVLSMMIWNVGEYTVLHNYVKFINFYI